MRPTGIFVAVRHASNPGFNVARVGLPIFDTCIKPAVLKRLLPTYMLPFRQRNNELVVQNETILFLVKILGTGEELL